MPAPSKSLPRLLALALLALGGLSCVDGPTGIVPQGSVTVTPEAISLRPLDTARLSVVVRSVDGRLIPVPIVDWRALDTTIATVDSTGLVTAASYTGPEVRYTKLVVGSLGARSDTVPVEVLPFLVARVRTLVDTVNLRPRDTLTVGARVENAAGVELNGRPILWLSSDTSALETREDGLLRAKPYFGPATRTVFGVVFSGGEADSVAVVIHPLPIASIIAQPQSITLEPGQQGTVAVVARTAQGDRLDSPGVNWRSTDTTVVRVNQEGILTAQYYVGLSTRSAAVVLQAGTGTDTVAVHVTPLSVSRVTIAPDTALVTPGAAVALGVSLFDAAGLQLEQRPMLWTSLDQSVATVDSIGRVRATVYGGPDTRSARITASVNGRADTAVVLVAPHVTRWITATPEAVSLRPGDTTSISAALLSQYLTPLTGRSTQWSSLDSTVASVAATGGTTARLTARPYTGPLRRLTSVIVSHTSPEPRPVTTTDTIPIEVLPLATARVEASLDSVVLLPRDSVALSATPRAANELALTERATAWIVEDTTVAKVTAAGLLRAVHYVGPLEHRTNAIVFIDGLADTVVVVVKPFDPTSLRVAPDSLILTPGRFGEFTALLRSTFGDTLREFSIAWQSADTTVARVNAAGIVTASFYAGSDVRSTQVTTSIGSVADTGIVVVNPLSVARVTITPDSGTLRPGATFQLDAALRDADDVLLTGRPITWSALDSARAVIDATGLVTAAVFGGADVRTARFVASAGGAADTVTLTIAPHDVRFIAATPEALSLSPLDSAALSAELLAIDLTVLNGRAVHYASLDTTVVRVSPVGIATAALYPGSATRTSAILVTSGAAVDTVPVTVTPFAVASVVATPAALTLAVGDSATIALRLSSASDVTLDGRETAWLVSDTSMLAVRANGVVRAKPYSGPLTRTAQVVVFAEGLADTVAVTVTPRAAAAVSLAPASFTLRPGDVDTLVARVETSSGDILVDFPITWTSSDTTVAFVNAEGVVTASYYVGAVTRTARLIASTGSIADTSVVEVTPLSVERLALSPDTASLLPGNELQLDVIVRDAADLQLTDRVITYASDALSVATVSATGRVTVLASGRPDSVVVRITATSEGRADTTTITVRPHPVAWVTATPEAIALVPLGADTLSATQQSFDLTPLTGRTVSYSTLDASVATVTPSGIVTATAYTGPATRTTAILVTSEGIADTVPVSVSPLAAARVIATPTAVTLTLADTAVLAWRTESLDGTTLTERAFLWLSGDTAMFNVDTGGVVRPRPYSGPLTRTAFAVVFSEGFADSVEVTITPDAAAELIVAPTAIELLPGGVDTASVVVRTAGGATLSGFPVSWTSADPAIATVNVEGIITAMFYAGGDTREVPVIAALSALRDTTIVRVLPYGVASVVITPDTGSLLPSATFQLDATVRNAEAVFLTGRTVTWTSLDPAIATVNSAGLVTAAASGRIDTVTARVVASVASVADTITLVVRPHEAAWVTATPEALSILPGDTITIAPTVLSLGLTPLLSRSVSFSTLDAAVATVSTEGLVTATAFTAPALRNTSIIVTSGAASDTVPVEVRPLAVARVIAVADSLTLNATDTVALVARVESSNGVTLTGRALLWLSSDTAVALVTPDTLVVATRYLGVDTLSTTLVVYSEGLADTVVVTRLPRAPAALDVPDTTTTFPGQQVTVSAATLSAFGDTLTGHVVQWATRDAAVAQVNADGIVTGSFYAGPDTRETFIVAAVGTLTDSTLARIRPLLVDSVAIFPDTATLKPNRTWEPSAVLRDAAGTFLSGRTPTWTSTDTIVATVSASGMVTTRRAGTVSIIASLGAGADTATLTVVHPAVSVSIDPANAALGVGDVQTLTAEVLDSASTILTDRDVRWTSSDNTIASVSALGVVTALAAGAVTITASVEGLTSTVTVTVAPPPAAFSAASDMVAQGFTPRTTPSRAASGR